MADPPIRELGSYRLNAKRILLTFPQLNPGFTKEEALSRLRSKKWGSSQLDQCLVVLERHKDGTPHLHIATSWTAKLNLHSAQCFDFVTGKQICSTNLLLKHENLAYFAYRQTWRLSGHQELAEYHRIPDEGRPGTPGFWDRPPIPGALQEEMEIWISEGQSRYDSTSIVYWGEDPTRYPKVMIMTMVNLLIINIITNKI